MTTTPSTADEAEEQIDRALYLIASRRLAAPSALQRWMRITFARAVNLLNELEKRGNIGPADGSRAREIYVRYCEQCGRIGMRGYRTHTAAEHGIEITVCVSQGACRKRRPKPAVDEAS
jgi:hypothetical protein